MPGTHRTRRGARERPRHRTAAAAAAAVLAVLATACAGRTAPSSAPAQADRPPAVSSAPIAPDLAVATFDTAWTRIARQHYDSAFNGVDWDAVRAELRPKAADAATVGALRSVIGEMLERLGESHYALIPQEVSHALETPAESDAGGEPGDLGIEARIVDGRVVVFRVDADGPAHAAGVRPGWVIERVGTQELAVALDRVEALEGSERRIAQTRFTYAINAVMGGAAGSAVEIAFVDGGDRPVVLDLTRRVRPGEQVRFGNLPAFFTTFEHERVPLQGGGCVGVIRFSVWMLPVAAAFDRAIDEVRDCAGVVIDVRGNPGGVAGMVMGIAGHFFAAPTPLGILRQRGAELKLTANPRRVDAENRAVEPVDGRVAVLTDEASVSTSEIFAAGMQAQGRARIFGDTTAGQALPAVAARLPNGDVLMYVIADLTGPDGRRIEGSGVAPDEMVPLTRAGLLAGRDAPLEAAIRWIAGRPAALHTPRDADALPARSGERFESR